ncbi:MAG TPA: CheR family methyltransferase [Myxococcaceae bacterium]|nr:CheR family methyltransferase [Myxococcaceae bacterium]
MASGGAELLSPICAYVSERTGTSLSRQQIQRLQEALATTLAGRDEEEYVRHLQSPRGAAELAELMSVISVHKTDLFRDEVQLTAFRNHVLDKQAATGRALKIWSAGCATGEEVATLLILLAEAGADAGSTVLGTDISETALKQARRLSFQSETMARVPPPLRERYFKQTPQGGELVADLHSRARFERHNLMDQPYPGTGEFQFDVIFCRNVLIYFTEAAFDRTVVGLAQRLAVGGTLVLSAAEPILRPVPDLATVRSGEAFFYRRRDPSEQAIARTFTGEVEIPLLPSPTLPPPAGPAPAAPPPRPKLPVAPVVDDPRREAREIFQLVLDWAAAGEPDALTEQGLRRALYLDPHFAQARYLLGMLLEQRGSRADAAGEYRRALAALNEGKAQVTPFFLNNERLKGACKLALRRVGFGR